MQVLGYPASDRASYEDALAGGHPLSCPECGWVGYVSVKKAK
jgi:hypothetical protein